MKKKIIHVPVILANSVKSSISNGSLKILDLSIALIKHSHDNFGRIDTCEKFSSEKVENIKAINAGTGFIKSVHWLESKKSEVWITTCLDTGLTTIEFPDEMGCTA
jgi:hypothetical protein